jgi:hypothetical protein
VVVGNGDVIHDRWIYTHPSRVGGGVCVDSVKPGPPGHIGECSLGNLEDIAPVKFQTLLNVLKGDGMLQPLSRLSELSRVICPVSSP